MSIIEATEERAVVLAEAEGWGAACRYRPKVGVQLGRIGRRLTCNKAMRAIGSAEAEGCGSARMYKPKADKRRGYGGRQTPKVGVQLGRTGRKLTSNDATRAVRMILSTKAET